MTIDSVMLREEQQQELSRIAQSRSLPAEYVFCARLILMLAEGASFSTIKQRLGATAPTIIRWKHRFVASGTCLRGPCWSRLEILTVALPFCHFELRTARSKRAQYPKQINSLGDHIRARRLDLKLLQEQVANKIGVHETTITGWEGNATFPAVRYMPAIIQFLGYNPLPAANSLPERIATARRALGLSQRKMAVRLGVDPATFMGWEAGRHQPTGKSIELIGKALPFG
jgi:transcriptional regulator with XRE-family HTH domain